MASGREGAVTRRSRTPCGIWRRVTSGGSISVRAAKSAVARPEERHVVGFNLRREPEDGSVEVGLSKRSKTRVDEKVRELVPRNWGRSLRDCILQLNAYLLGWIGFFWICTEAAARMLSNLDAPIRDAPIRRRLRALLLKQWKRKRTIAHRLIRLGVKPKPRRCGRSTRGIAPGGRSATARPWVGDCVTRTSPSVGSFLWRPSGGNSKAEPSSPRRSLRCRWDSCGWKHRRRTTRATSNAGVPKSRM
ncbi:group II intron maturase-specific domain-containing protein [Sorangium sp. So ce1014]|uniref:group II intron maturase-specific domain-containing protein n=1 Tax=Sorangium sp. So ce1014 TaxID=3133326 RepID=UPI003F622246